MFGFVETYKCQIDGKGRVSLPAPYRRTVPVRPFMLLKWQTSHLTLYTAEAWAKIEKKLVEHRSRTGDGGAFIRKYAPLAKPVEPDAHGRIRIPQLLRDEAGLKNAVLFSGSVDRIEVWDPDVYEKESARPYEEKIAELKEFGEAVEIFS